MQVPLYLSKHGNASIAVTVKTWQCQYRCTCRNMTMPVSVYLSKHGNASIAVPVKTWQCQYRCTCRNMAMPVSVYLSKHGNASIAVSVKTFLQMNHHVLLYLVLLLQFTSLMGTCNYWGSFFYSLLKHKTHVNKHNK